MDYSKTVNLLQTDFPMKGDLPKREPLMLDHWKKNDLYGKIQKKGEGKPTFLLHDGPPYANGVIHMGHALNKTLKDIVVKYKTMQGFRAPYKPGWDCHGLPIEHALFKKLKKSKHDISRLDLRKQATEYALDFVDKQRSDFKRLGIFGEWDNPYLTLNKGYEAGIVQIFLELKKKGKIYRGKKPGYWCAFDETALAEAEVEYANKKSDSVFVRFKVKSTPPSLPSERGGKVNIPPPNGGRLGGGNLHVLIWTTTPWTLPANVGLAFHPDEKYVVIKHNGDQYIVADKLKDIVYKKIVGARRGLAQQPGATGRPTGSPLQTVGDPFRGKELVGMVATNPIHGRDSKAVTAPYVTMEDGTGIVHIAPGHGVEDFGVGQQWKLDVISPVDERGRYTKEVGEPRLEGKHVLKGANSEVMDVLGDNLVYYKVFEHSYPHCWRCKNPIIFRATDQWFLRVDDDLRKKLLAEIDRVKWEPAYGIHRIQGMVETRPDWCLSRQRHWGAPIAVFYQKSTGKVLNSDAVDQHIIKLIEKDGGDAWYKNSVQDILKAVPNAFPGVEPGDIEMENDILDVWFDSGVSWHSVVERDFSDPKPETVMYLEGSDQHRGWFQTSLIPSVTLRDKAPYQIVLTHGFVVDGKGHKMSKSMGNVISPQDIIKQYGADIIRLWVAMSDYREDVRLSQNIVKQVVDVYRRFRNSFRFLLQNTADFNFKKDQVSFEKMEEVDRWILVHFEKIKKTVLEAYEKYEFHLVLSELNRFAAVTLSGFYLDALKDRLYCESSTSPLRRSTQTALYHLAHGMSVLLAPLLSFTAEEAYLELRKNSNSKLKESVFLDETKEIASFPEDEMLDQKWNEILNVRALVNDVLDKQRKAGVLKSSQEASVAINISQLESKVQNVIESNKEAWPFLLQMAEVTIQPQNGKGQDPVVIEKTKFGKCVRCWRHRSSVGSDSKHSTLCDRCVSAVNA